MTNGSAPQRIAPQGGAGSPQSRFLASPSDIAIFGGAAGGGKAVALDTPLPTPTGWTTMLEVQPGDSLLDEQGRPCRVTAVSPIMLGHDVFDVVFDDGSVIRADADHEWLTSTVASRQVDTRRRTRPTPRYPQLARPQQATRPSLVTTREIARTLTIRGHTNHAIAVCAPLQLPEQELPLDPYVLGLWLGDGCSWNGEITTADAEVVTALESAGYQPHKIKKRYQYGTYGLTQRLRFAGVIRNKHIPPAYLRASEAQRRALLAGLMDTDGTALPGGACEFSTVLRHLAEQVHELLMTLGIKATIRSGRAKLNGRDTGPNYRIKFTTKTPIFRLTRKGERQTREERGTQAQRYIVNVRPVPSEPVKCVTVDSPSHLYLVGKSFIPTHNSFVLLMEPLRHVHNPGFGAVIFRRTYAEVTNEGGLWDTSELIYPHAAGRAQRGWLQWKFPSGATVRFAHLQYASSVYNWQGSQIPLLAFDEITHFCMHPETEVLTQDGWKCIDRVEVGEFVASLSPDRHIEYHPVEQTHAFSYDGDLITCFQEKGVSFRVTPNHKMVVNTQREDCSWTLKRADAIRVDRIPRTGVWEGQEQEWVELVRPTGRGHGPNSNSADRVRMDDWLEFLGWWFSEGCSFRRKNRTGTPVVCIRQTQPAPDLEALIDRLPWYCHRTKDGQYIFSSRQLFDYLHPIGDAYTKRIPRWIFALSRRQIEIFWNAFVRGDGHRVGNGVQIGLCNRRLIDDLQEMAFLLGWVATSGGYHTKTGYDVFSLSVSEPSRTATRVKQGVNLTREHYCGTVHCLTVGPHHTFLARHRGRYFWTGNSSTTFWYMLSRNRSMCGVRPYVRATCNPDPDSFVAPLIDWWIGEDGYPIPERSGVVRYFIREAGEIVWGDTKEELAAKYPGIPPKSFTFVASRLKDNKILMEADPGYLANLMALPLVERERLLSQSLWGSAKRCLT